MSVGHPDASFWCVKSFSGTLQAFHHCGSFCSNLVVVLFLFNSVVVPDVRNFKMSNSQLMYVELPVDTSSSKTTDLLLQVHAVTQKDQNKAWVLFTDTDESVSINYKTAADWNISSTTPPIS
jgi:hypothetical protein